MALTPDQIKAIYAKRRTKGLYTDLLSEFLATGENGISVREQWPQQFSWDASALDAEGKPRKLDDGTDANPGKQATTLKQGFENAKDRKDSPDGFEYVDVIVDGIEVYLINRAETDGLTPEDMAVLDESEVTAEPVEAQ